MQNVIILHTGEGDEEKNVTLAGRSLHLRRIGCGGNAERARALMRVFDGRAAALGLEGMPTQLRLGGSRRPHALSSLLLSTATQTPVVDGNGLRDGIERWAITLADRANPGIFSQRRVLMVPGLNHEGLAQAIGKRAAEVRYADPLIFFALPAAPGVGSPRSMTRVANATLERLQEAPFQLLAAHPGAPRYTRDHAPFDWADILAGDIGAIRRYAPHNLKRKIVVVEHADEADAADLRQRGVSILVTLMPSLDEAGSLGRFSAAALEAMLLALRANPEQPASEDAYLDLLADWEWAPTVRYLQPEEMGINRFAFVIHPLEIDFIHTHPAFRWTRFFPDPIVEAVAAYFPPIYISRITGGQSPVTGQRIEGYLFALGATPRQMMRHDERFTYERLNLAARMAERKGARIMGLGAFTSVVGDAETFA